MIAGHVSDDGIPHVTLDVAGREWVAIIDTGFNGDVELPQDPLPLVNAGFAGRVTSALAGGQQIIEDAYFVDFSFDGQFVRAQATFVDGHEILVGTGLLSAHRLEIDFVAGTVTIEAA